MRVFPAVKETFARHHARAMAADAPSFLLETMNRVGPDFWLGVGNVTLTMLSSPEALQHVLHRRATAWGRGSTLADTRPLLGNGLVASDPPLWLAQRRTMQPAFHHAHATKWLELISAATQRCLDALPTGSFSVRAQMLRLARESIVEALFSDAFDAEADQLAQAFEAIEGFMGERSLVLAKLPVSVSPGRERYLEAIRFIDARLSALVQARKAAPSPPLDLLTMLLRAVDPETGQTMSDQQLRDELMTVFLAGHETTANALTWAIALLATHPAEAALVVDEVRDAGPVTLATFGRLPRLNAVVREALRLYPPVWIIAREALEDDEVLGVRMPKGSVVMLPVFVTQRSPTLWPEPNAFRPERFLSESSTDATVWKFRYLPFGAGPHVCLGLRFALLECVVVLAGLYQQGTFVLGDPENLRHTVGTTLMVADGLPARFVRHR